MKGFSRMVPCLLLLLIPYGCAAQKPVIHFSPDANVYSGLKYAVYPFTDGNPERLDYRNSTDAVTAAFESALLPAVNLVKAGEEDVSVYGTVTAFYRGSLGGRFTTVGFEVKAVHKQTGKVLWTASHIKSSKWAHDYEPSRFAGELSREVVSQLQAKKKL